MRVRFGWFCLFFCLIGLTACHNSRRSTEINSENSDMLFPGEMSDSLVAYLERTRCFGVCPVYSISIYRSGCVVFEGNEHVKPLGNHFAFIDRNTLEGVGRKAEELGFFDLKDEYRNPHLTDFPTVYVEVRFKGKIKRVHHYDAEPPRNLVEMEDYIDKLFGDETKWTPFPTQNYKD